MYLQELKPYPNSKKKRIEVEDIEELISKLKSDAEPLIREARESMESQRRIREELKQIEALHSTLKILLDFNIDPSRLQKLKRFYAVFTVVESRSVDEIKKSLLTSYTIDTPIGKNYSALLIISLREEEEKVDRVLRGFGVKPFPKFLQQLF
jgi:vacuolar-type H+-ATPase subunit I/STV1